MKRWNAYKENLLPCRRAVSVKTYGRTQDFFMRRDRTSQTAGGAC